MAAVFLYFGGSGNWSVHMQIDREFDELSRYFAFTLDEVPQMDYEFLAKRKVKTGES